MHTAKCEICETEVQFATYKHDWPKGWTQSKRSRWGKKYNQKSGWAWWCPRCQPFAGFEKQLQRWLGLLPFYLRDGILAHLPGLANKPKEQ
jgi:hypothetical protein